MPSVYDEPFALKTPTAFNLGVTAMSPMWAFYAAAGEAGLRLLGGSRTRAIEAASPAPAAAELSEAAVERVPAETMAAPETPEPAAEPQPVDPRVEEISAAIVAAYEPGDEAASDRYAPEPAADHSRGELLAHASTVALIDVEPVNETLISGADARPRKGRKAQRADA